jgi:hypothetical protein
MTLSLPFLAAHSFLAAASTDATAPVITMDFAESASGLMKIKPYTGGEHAVKKSTPHAKEVPADPTMKASYGVCIAGDPRNIKDCKLPSAQAYDHHDGGLEVTKTTHLVNVNVKAGQRGSGKCEGKDQEEKINWDRRSEYIIKYNAQDKSGNSAEEIFFSLVLDDPIAPIIKSIASRTIESSWTGNAKTLHSKIGERRYWTMPPPSARDNIDGPVVATVSRTRVFDSKKLGRYSVVLTSSDKAACYGKKHQNNKATKVVWITVKDTLKPWIERRGASSLTWECAIRYTDAGAKCYDRHDSTSTNGLALAPIRHSVVNPATTSKSPAAFHVVYNCKDSQGLAASTVSRHVTVVDTTKPNLKITHIKEQKSARGTYAKLTANDLDKKSIFSEEKDSKVIHHSTGYKLDLKYIERLSQKGYGYTCTDTCDAPTKPTVTTHYEKCAEYTCVKQGLAKCASLKCDSGWKKVSKYNGKEAGAYKLNYICKDHVGNTAKKSRIIFNEDMQSIALVKTKFGFTCPTVEKFVTALTKVILNAFPKSGFSEKHIEIDTLNGKPYIKGKSRRLVEEVRRQTVMAVLVMDDLSILRRVVSFVRSPVFKKNLDKACACTSTPGPPLVDIPPNPFKPWIVLHKGDTTIVEASTTAKFIDAGAVCSDNQDGKICDTKNGKYGPVKQSRFCKSTSMVQVHKPSPKIRPYQVTYDCQDSRYLHAFQGVRYVHVRDTTKPICKVIGNVKGTHEAGFKYTDKFASATDTLDGKITRKCAGKVTKGCIRTFGLSKVNVDVPATYYVDYQAVDAAGNVGKKCRRSITVVDSLKPVIALKYKKEDGSYFHIGDSTDTSKTHDGKTVTNPAGDYFKK